MAGTATGLTNNPAFLARCLEDDNQTYRNAPKNHEKIIRFKNDIGIWKIHIGEKAFVCIGASPPHDHPHIYLEMGASHEIICPYCATRYSYQHELKGDASDPSGCAHTPPAEKNSNRK
jgi:uncharacterized Zn-finger protein